MTLMLEKEAERAIQTVQPTRRSALAEMANRYQISQDNLINVIKKTVIKGNCTDAEFQALIVVANQYGLNPLTKEIHAFASNGAIVPIVGIDGWSKIVNSQPRFDGCEFEETNIDGDVGVTCIMYVKDRAHPVRLTEYLKECKRNTAPWNTMPRRMLRHKAFMQAARLAFSIGGIYDEDEARDIVNNGDGGESTRTTGLLERLATSRPVSEGQTVDIADAQELPADEPVINAPKDTINTNQDSQTREVEQPEPDDADVWNAGRTYADFLSLVARKAPSNLPTPDEGVKRFEKWANLSLPGKGDRLTRWNKIPSSGKENIWKAILAGDPKFYGAD